MADYKKLKAEYEALKARKIQVEARREVHLDELRKMGIATVEDARSRIEKLDRTIQRDEEKMAEILGKVEGALNG